MTNLLFHTDQLGFATARERLENFDVCLDRRAAKRLHFADKEVIHACYNLRRNTEWLQTQIRIILGTFGKCDPIFFYITTTI